MSMLTVEFFGGIWHGQLREVDRVVPKWTVPWHSAEDSGCDVYVARKYGPRWYYLSEDVSEGEFLTSKTIECMLYYLGSGGPTPEEDEALL